MAKPIEIPIQISGVAQVRKEIKALTGEFLNAGSELEKAQLAEKIGQLKDQLIDANEQAAIFASGSKYEQVGNAFGQIKANIMNLDFEGASEKAKSLAVAAKGISFKDAVGSLKSLGSTFLTLGKTLLTNPLFLIAAVIAAIGFAIFNLLKKLGIIDKAFKAVGDAIKKVWEWIKKAIEIMSYFNPAAFIVNWLIKLNDKANAEKEALENQRKAADERIKQLKKEEEAIGDKYDFEIRLLKAQGKDTTEVEAEKRKAILATLAAQNDALRVLIQTGKATQDQIKVWNETNKKIKTINQDTAIAAAEAQTKATADAKKAADERTKIAEDEAKKSAEAAKKYAEDRKNTARLIQDLETELIQDTLVREIESNKIKYERLIADTIANESLLASEKERIILDYEKQRNLAQEKIIADDRAAGEAKIAEDEQKAKDELQLAFEQSQAVKELYLQARELDIEDKDFKGLIALSEDKFQIELDTLKNQLEQKNITVEEYNAQELLLTKKLEDDKLALQKQAAAQAAAQRKAVEEGALDVSKQVLSGVQANLKEGSKAAKGVAVAQATIDTYKGAQSAYASTVGIPVIGPALAPVAAAAAIALGVANVRKILAVNPTSGGGSPSSAAPRASSASSASTQSVPSFNLFGGGNNLNEQTAGQNRDSGPQVIQAVVSETEVTSTQERVSKIQQRSEL